MLFRTSPFTRRRLCRLINRYDANIRLYISTHTHHIALNTATTTRGADTHGAYSNVDSNYLMNLLTARGLPGIVTASPPRTAIASQS